MILLDHFLFAELMENFSEVQITGFFESHLTCSCFSVIIHGETYKGEEAVEEEKRIWTAMVLIWMVVIFMFSAKPADESSKEVFLWAG